MPESKESAADRAERLLIERILDGTYPPGADLPGERVLCQEFGVARPALRESLQRLSRDGWLEIQHGKSTRVIDLMRGGTLSILTGLVKADSRLYGNFVPDTLEMWSLLAPAYTARAVERAPRIVIDMLSGFRGLDDRPEPLVRSMWRMHRVLIDTAGNLVYGLIFNSFSDFYQRLALVYYREPDRRAEARALWDDMLTTATRGDAGGTANLLGEYIQRKYEFWRFAAIYDLLDEEGNEGESDLAEGKSK